MIFSAKIILIIKSIFLIKFKLDLNEFEDKSDNVI